MTSLERATAKGKSSKKRWTRKEKSTRAELEREGEHNDSQSRSCSSKAPPPSITAFERMIRIAKGALKTDSVLFDEDGLRSGFEIRVVTACALPPEPLPSTIHVKPLLVLDLNGVLCHRIRKTREDMYPHLVYRPSPVCVASTRIVPRTNLVHFLTFLDTHFTLAVWTSAKGKTAKQLVSLLIPDKISKKLLFIWAQNQCNIVPAGVESIFVKNLEKAWSSFPLWNASNTLLMDDSPDKCPVSGSAIHPPALHGKISGDMNVMSDADNERFQMEFFHRLAVFFRNQRETLLFANGIGEGRNSEGLHGFLENTANDHMGWRGVAVGKATSTSAYSLASLRPTQVVYMRDC